MAPTPTPTPKEGGSPSPVDLGLPDGDPPEFPESDAGMAIHKAGVLDEWATVGEIAQIALTLPTYGASWLVDIKTYSAGIQAMIDTVKKILGDWTVARDTALGWANAATVPATIKTDLEDKLFVTDAYWGGGAFDAFSGHMDSVNTALSDTSAKMVDIAKTAATAIGYVYDTYAAAIAFITSVAADLAGVVAPWKLADLITGVIENVGNLISDAIGIMGGYQTDITNLKIDAITFPSLPDHPDTLDTISTPDKWEVDPAPENPPEPVD